MEDSLLRLMSGVDSKTASRVYAHSETRRAAGDSVLNSCLDSLEDYGHDLWGSPQHLGPAVNDDDGYESTAHRVYTQSFRAVDTCESASQEAILVDRDPYLGTRKFVFRDASFLVVRKEDVVPVDPRSGASLWRYAKWVGYSVRECAILVTLFNLLDAITNTVN